MILKKLIFILIFLPFFSNSQDFGKLPFKSWTSLPDYSDDEIYGDQIQKEEIRDTCIAGDCQNGEGTMIYIDLMGNRNGNPPGCRATYNGNWKDGKRSGFGIFTKENCISGADFRIYTGKWLNDKRHGKGIDIYAPKGASAGDFELIDDNSLKKMNAMTIIIDGNWFEDKLKGKAEIIEFCCDRKSVFNVYFKNNLKNGFGTFKSSNGYEYKGYYKDDYQNGQGTYTFPDGGKYVGKWKDDYQNGQGTYTWPSGSKYVGEWKDGKQDGQGTYSYADGQIMYKGQYKESLRHGKGKYTPKTLVFYSYEGEFKNGEKDGYGKSVSGKSTHIQITYEGDFKTDEKNGSGKETVIQKNKLCELFEGEWKNSYKEGFGKLEHFYKGNQLEYVGRFEKDEFNGHGVLKNNKGEFSGNFEKGILVGDITIKYKNGDKYSGEIDYKSRDRYVQNGKGSMQYNNGDYYYGSWENGKRKFGRMEFFDGMQYFGNWSGDEFEYFPFSWDDNVLKAYIGNEENLEKIEGLYRYQNKNQNADYKFYIRKDSDTRYHALLVEGKCVGCEKWKIGDRKFQMIETAIDDVYDVIWKNPDFSISNILFYTNENGSLITDNNTISLVKLYPKTNVKSTNSYNTEWKGNGSGVIISKSGYIVTNHHIVEGMNAFEVEFMYGKKITSFNAKVVKSDATNDLAIIKIDDAKFKNLRNIPYSFKTRSSDVGTEVFALGYPMALTIMGKDIKFTDGKISSKTGFKGDITTYQTTTPIQAGNSGGPLFDFNGNLIGINSSGLDKGLADNVSYSIKSRYLLDLIDVLPESIELPSSKELASKPLTEQIKVLSDYVVLIKVK